MQQKSGGLVMCCSESSMPCECSDSWSRLPELANFTEQSAKHAAHQGKVTKVTKVKTARKRKMAGKTTGTKTQSHEHFMCYEEKRSPYWTYWFLVWHRTHLPVDQSPGTGTGSGQCG